MVFRALVVSVMLMVASASAFAADDDVKAPRLADLMKQPTYRAAWLGMLAGETPPPWVVEYAKTLDGPPSPAIPVLVGANSYTMGFTCKPNGCGDDQLYVLFAPSGATAWGLLLTGKQKKWLGSPSQTIQDAMLSAVE